jgi:hypothetical protein
MNATPAYLVRLQLKEGVADTGECPFIIPVIRTLNIEFTAPVTFFVGVRPIASFETASPPKSLVFSAPPENNISCSAASAVALVTLPWLSASR